MQDDLNKNGYNERFHENGKLFYTGVMRNNKRIGPWENYFQSGNLRWKGSFTAKSEQIGFWQQVEDVFTDRNKPFDYFYAR